MNINLIIEKEEPSVTVLMVTLTFILFYILNKKLSNKETLTLFQKEILKKTMGIIFFAVIPIVTIIFFYRQPVREYGMALPNKPYFIPLSLGIYAIIFPFLLIHSKTEEGERKFLYTFGKNENSAHIVYRILFWIIYIGGYEFCFRGFLLFSLYKNWGAVPAIIISTSIYSLAHTGKGAGEIAGSMVMGFIFGSTVLASKSIIPSFIIHVLIASTTDIILLRSYRKK